ncbi:MAG: hypothetical protein HRU15_10450, partial [Planctomycetes bacterium]|nr:hypothetical protein [Planctomycetota bacterium]
MTDQNQDLEAPQYSGFYAYLQRRYSILAILVFIGAAVLIPSLALRSIFHVADVLSNFYLF